MPHPFEKLEKSILSQNDSMRRALSPALFICSKVLDNKSAYAYHSDMKNITKEIEQFKQKNPDVAKAMEVFQMSMADYKRAYGFMNEPRTYTSKTTSLSENDKLS